MIIRLLSLLLLMTLFACSANQPNKETREIIFAPYQVDCEGAFPQKCFVEILNNGEKEYFYEDIEGFDFEPGYKYRLSINAIPRCDIKNHTECPQDVGIYRYELNELLSKEASGSNLEKTFFQMLPEAKKGFKKIVIQLQKLKNEQNVKVELFAIKKDWVDCNIRSLIGFFEQKILPSNGRSYYEFISNGISLSTRKSCGEPAKQGEIMSQKRVVQYNSEIPIIIYIRENMNIKHSILSKEKRL